MSIGPDGAAPGGKRSAGEAGQAGLAEDTAALKVLVIDDMPAILSILRTNLSAKGHRVSLAASGEEAIGLLERDAFDAVLIDMVMPDRSGLEILAEVRGRWPASRLVAMSGSTELLAAAKGAGAHAVLRKPFRRADVYDALKAA